MGRGRQKAKQTKVARELKYYSPSTDYSALEKELSVSPKPVFEKHKTEDKDKNSEYDEKNNAEPNSAN